MTIHPSIIDMSAAEPTEDEEMAGRISPRDIVRANLDGKPANKIVARVVELDGEWWGAQFAVPGKVPDFTRDLNGAVTLYGSEAEAYHAALDAAVRLFNMPREHLSTFGNSRMGNKAAGDIRPAKMTTAAMSAAMSAAGLNSSDLVFLLDKPAKRILDWSNTGDIPHEVRLLLEIFAKFDEAVDFAFERTNEAIEIAEKQKGR